MVSAGAVVSAGGGGPAGGGGGAVAAAAFRPRLAGRPGAALASRCAVAPSRARPAHAPTDEPDGERRLLARLHEGAAALGDRESPGRFPRFAIRNCVGPGRAVRATLQARSVIVTATRAGGAVPEASATPGQARTQSATAARAAGEIRSIPPPSSAPTWSAKPLSEGGFCPFPLGSVAFGPHGAWRRLGPQALASAGARLRRVLHGDPGRGDRERRAAVDPGGPRDLPRHAPVDRHRLLARVRRFLLLGGRSADLLGRRKVFMFGMVLFTAAHSPAGSPTAGRN